MPVTRIRDSIATEVNTDVDGFAYITRRINLPDNHRFTAQAIDVFCDNVLMPIKLDPASPLPAGYQLFISPYPVLQTNEIFGPSPVGARANSGPLAGDDGILYCEKGLTTLSDVAHTQYRYLRDQFPNDVLAANANMTWFTDHVYVTVLIYNEPESTIDVKVSFYIEVNAKKTGYVSLTMGRMQEFLGAQCRLLNEMGVVVNPARTHGNTFPAWKFGGIRPELMVSSANALIYYNRQASNAAADMLDTGTLSTNFKEAITMVDYDAAFGGGVLSALGQFPDWLQIFNASGITSGAIRQYPPPLKFADNGNTLML
jgi:hypothetical protein